MSRRPARRYPDAASLLSSAREEVILEIAVRTGVPDPWPASQQAHLDRSIAAQTVESESRSLLNDLIEVTRRIDRHVAARTAAPFAKGRAVRAVVGPDPHLDALRRAQRALSAVSFGPGYASRRLALLRAWDRPGARWWWQKTPTVRDLSMLSLLAGNGKEWARGHPHSSVLELRRAEERAIREAQKRTRDIG